MSDFWGAEKNCYLVSFFCFYRKYLKKVEGLAKRSCTFIVNYWRSKCFVFCVTTDVYLVQDLWHQILAWHCLYTALVEFPRLSKIDRFAHTERDRKTEFLSLSLRSFTASPLCSSFTITQIIMFFVWFLNVSFLTFLRPATSAGGGSAWSWRPSIVRTRAWSAWPQSPTSWTGDYW